MRKQWLLIATTLFVTVGTASAQNEPSQDTMRGPTGLESTAPNNPPIATVPEAATDASRDARISDERTGSQRFEEDGPGNGPCGG